MKWGLKAENLKASSRLILIASSAMSAVAGAAVAYVSMTKTLEKKYREIADAEIQEAKIYYQGLYTRSPFVISDEPKEADVQEPQPGNWDELGEMAKERIITKAVEALVEYSPSTVDPNPVVETVDSGPDTVVVNIFESNVPPGEEVLSALMSDRDPTEPYIITKDEYYNNDPDHEQRGFTYYAGDEVLVDDSNEYDPIEDIERVVGQENLLRFGYGSGDNNTLYVRNESVDPPFDLYISRSVGRYVDEVMGFADEKGPHLKHAQKRFRLDDD